MISDRYEVVLADSDEARKIHYQMRYQVYCLEQGWEPADAFPDREEKDEFDVRAAHFLIRNRHLDQWAGTLRVVLPGSGPLPIESLDVLKHPRHPEMPGGSAAEISRVCRPRAAADPRYDAQDSLRGASEVLIRLLRGAGEYCREQHIDHLYMFCRPAMARLLQRLSVPVVRVGIPTDHHGVRVPYLVDISAAFSHASHACPLLARLFREAVAYRHYSVSAYASRQRQAVRAACAA